MLTGKTIENLAPKENVYFVNDGKGLRLRISTNGSKLWRFTYRINGKQKSIAIGRYPKLSLKAARLLAITMRLEVAEGIDPSMEKAKTGNKAPTLLSISEQWW